MTRPQQLGAAYSILFVCAVFGQVSRTAQPSNLGTIDSRVSYDSGATGVEKPTFRSEFLPAFPDVKSVHAGTLTQLPDGGMLAAWFGGTREGAKDVRVYTARSTDSGWSPATPVASRYDTMNDLGCYILKLGNPVLFTDSNDRVWLYYVVVSVGGWSGSSIATKYSDDFGETWSPAKRLITSPTLNISTLVKGRPHETNAGFIALPVYHESLRMFSELLWLDRSGSLVRKDRLTHQNGTLQPCILGDGKNLRAWYRRSSAAPPRVLTNSSASSDTSWSELETTNVANPNSATTAIDRYNGGFLMVANPTEKGRNKLSICVSADGIDWTEVHDLEIGELDEGYSYPYIIHGDVGLYHVVYTWKRERMKLASFNDAWLEEIQ